MVNSDRCIWWSVVSDFCSGSFFAQGNLFGCIDKCFDLYGADALPDVHAELVFGLVLAHRIWNVVGVGFLREFFAASEADPIHVLPNHADQKRNPVKS